MITFDCCPSADLESDSADSAAADIPASDSNRIEPDLSSEGEVEDSRAPAAILRQNMLPKRNLRKMMAQIIQNTRALSTAFTHISQNSTVFQREDVRISSFRRLLRDGNLACPDLET